MARKLLGAVAVLAAGVVVVGAWAWHEVRTRPASPSLHEDVKALARRYPELKPSYDKCMEDGVLTVLEANALVEELQKTKKKQPR